MNPIMNYCDWPIIFSALLEYLGESIERAQTLRDVILHGRVVDAKLCLGVR